MNVGWLKFMLGLSLLLAACGTSRPAAADLATSIQPSLEWLVDSCDAIYLAHIGPMRGIENRNFVNHWEPYKLIIARGPLAGYVRQEQLNRGGRWLCFFRWQPGGWHFIHAIDLDHPVAKSHTSAITAEGEVLRDDRSILDFVSERVNMKRSLPAGANPTDLESLNSAHATLTKGNTFPEVAQRRLGGFLRYQMIEVWDNALPDDEEVEERGMLVTGLIVPADAPNRNHLISKLEKQLEREMPRHRFEEIKNDVWALVNFHDAEAIELLDRYEQLDRDGILPEGILAQIAREIRRYWRFVDSLEDPANDALPGRWELQLRPTELKTSPIHPRFWMDVILTRDQSFIATCYRITRPGDEAEVCRQLKGYWIAEGGEFVLAETKVIAENGGQPSEWSPLRKGEGLLDREAMAATLDTGSGYQLVFRRIADLPLPMAAD